MTSEQFVYIGISLAGLFFVIRFREVGKDVLEKQNKFNKIMPTEPKKFYEQKNILLYTQFSFLIFGIILILVGLSALLKLFQ